MAKAPVVDEEICIGCGNCAKICPKVFELVNEKSQVIGPDKYDTCNCEEAIEDCPVQAISWSD
jgi:ferredoxin